MKFDYHDVLKTVASTTMIAAAILISISPRLAAEGAWVYCMFAFVHVVWAVYAYTMGEKSLLMMNVGLLPVDFYAISIRL